MINTNAYNLFYHFITCRQECFVINERQKRTFFNLMRSSEAFQQERQIQRCYVTTGGRSSILTRSKPAGCVVLKPSLTTSPTSWKHVQEKKQVSFVFYLNCALHTHIDKPVCFLTTSNILMPGTCPMIT